MSTLQGASVSQKLLRKRKRHSDKSEEQYPPAGEAAPEPSVAQDDEKGGAKEEDEDEDEDVRKSSTTATKTTAVPTKLHDGGKKPRRAPKKADGGGAGGGATPSSAPALKRKGSSFVESAVPWPAHFKTLEQTYRALNLVYTFCCTRKHLATTFDTIKSSVEAHIKRSLEVEEIAQIKVLMPLAINFVYVDEELLQVNVMGSNSASVDRRLKEFVVKEPAVEEGGDGGGGGPKEVLLFEFVDGDLNHRARKAKPGEATPVRQFRPDDVKMPVFNQKQVMNLIEKRNKRFTSAVNAFLNECLANDVDPVERIQQEYSAFVPEPSESRSTTPGPSFQVALPREIPTERKPIPDIIDEIKTLNWYTGQIVPDGHRVFDPQVPIYGDLSFQLSQSLVNALYNARGITQLYAHQAEAINNLYNGHNVIVSTSTSSGKSLIYQLPVLHELEKDMDTRAMYIFPTKALAQDQRRSLKELLCLMPGLEDIMVETFDGDTAMGDRNSIRDDARIIFTNPDMLHITILPQEENWRSFLQHLKFVVVDELHVYNSLFGAHVALIMRRLRRICAAVGNHNIKFISCSATVANPKDHMKMIFGVDDVELTDVDGSPSGRKEFLCWNTPYKDPSDPTSGRGDSIYESARLFCQLILRGVRVIAFCRVRKQCESLLGAVKTELTRLERPEVVSRVMSYRGGYTPQDRRQIEKQMFEGQLVGIVATSALELGIDIGSLDAVITAGFPYTIANLRQQSGRAGRRNKDSLSVLVGDSFPADQFFMSNPDELFTRPNCELQVDLENILVLEGHVQCAAHEMPIRLEEDEAYFGSKLLSMAKDRMRQDDMGFYHCNERFLPRPSKFVAIRDTEEDHFAIVDITNQRNIVIEELEASRAFYTIYEGGIFMHQGNTYLVRECSQDRMIARVERVKVDWTTQQRDFTDIDPVETEAIRHIPNSLSRAFYGPIQIKQVVFGFFKVDKKRRILDAVEVDNPPIVRFSKGMWIDVPKSALDILNSRRMNIAGAIHGAEHAVLSLMPNFVISMPDDVRTECKNSIKEFAKRETTRKRPARLIFYDAKGGTAGAGISTRAFEFIDVLLKQACDRVGTCHCMDGCLECCCSERCHQENQVMSKAGAEVVLKTLLNREIDIEALPWGPEEAVPGGIETVVPAEEVRGALGSSLDVY